MYSIKEQQQDLVSALQLKAIEAVLHSRLTARDLVTSLSQAIDKLISLHGTYYRSDGSAFTIPDEPRVAQVEEPRCSEPASECAEGIVA
jgi:hypothetical protein